MRGFLVFLSLVVMAACDCSVSPKGDLDVGGFMSMTDECSMKMRAQVDMELRAALTYMAMGAHFSLDTINRPGFAKMFFESASEEREHAFKIIEYLLMRGQLESIDEERIISMKPAAVADTWASPLDAMKAALELEISVTRNITDIVKACEASPCKEDKPKGVECKHFHFENDYHLVDYLTGTFLEEQLHGQRELAGRIVTLGKMIASQGALAEFLFDKKLLNGEPL